MAAAAAAALSPAQDLDFDGRRLLALPLPLRGLTLISGKHTHTHTGRGREVSRTGLAQAVYISLNASLTLVQTHSSSDNNLHKAADNGSAPPRHFAHHKHNLPHCLTTLPSPTPPHPSAAACSMRCATEIVILCPFWSGLRRGCSPVKYSRPRLD